MIKVLIEKRDDSIAYLEVKGHANSADKGEDLICSAVSAILTGGFNAIDEKEVDLTLKEGLAIAKAKKPLSPRNKIVLETILIQLQTIEEEYPNNLKINVK